MTGKTMSQDTNEFIFLKARVSSNNKGLYGLFFILFDPNLKSYKKMDILISHYQSLLDEIAPDDKWPSFSWSALEDMIGYIRLSGQFADSLTRTLYKTLENTLGSADIENILTMVLKHDVEELDFKFTKIFRTELGGGEFKFDFNFETVTEEEMDLKDQLKEEAIAAEQDYMETQTHVFEEEKHQTLSDNALIDISFVLSPVSGIPIGNLKVGDEIMIRIDISKPKGRYFSKLLNALEDTGSKPISSTVEKISQSPTGEYFIITKIQAGIYGKVSEDEKVNIKRYDPKKHKNESIDPDSDTGKKSIQMSSQGDSNSKFIYIILGVAFLLIILISLLFFFTELI